ncbi:hypothetical protein HNV12_02290 [Methanococcoides sp. SA1]|nr:hypothetical protein [Methanococcoides sp. SA1]
MDKIFWRDIVALSCALYFFLSPYSLRDRDVGRQCSLEKPRNLQLMLDVKESFYGDGNYPYLDLLRYLGYQGDIGKANRGKLSVTGDGIRFDIFSLENRKSVRTSVNATRAEIARYRVCKNPHGL